MLTQKAEMMRVYSNRRRHCLFSRYSTSHSSGCSAIKAQKRLPMSTDGRHSDLTENDELILYIYTRCRQRPRRPIQHFEIDRKVPCRSNCLRQRDARTRPPAGEPVWLHGGARRVNRCPRTHGGPLAVKSPMIIDQWR